MAVASSIEATALGIWRSLEEEEEDRREEADVLEGVRRRASRRTGVREVRFDGMPTGTALVDAGVFTSYRGLGPDRYIGNCSGCSFPPKDFIVFWGGTEVKRNALGTIILNGHAKANGSSGRFA